MYPIRGKIGIKDAPGAAVAGYRGALRLFLRAQRVKAANLVADQLPSRIGFEVARIHFVDMIEDERGFIGVKFANFQGDDSAFLIHEGREREHGVNAKGVCGGHAILFADQERVVEADFCSVFDDIFAKIDGNSHNFDAFIATFGTDLSQ